MQPAVLVSWVAVNNDPFERDRSRKYRLDAGGAEILGPTLTVLDDPASPLRGRIDTLVLLHRVPRTGEPAKELEAVGALKEELRLRLPALKVDVRPWPGANPTDHRAIYEFLREEMVSIRKRYSGRELLVHISPGTASMHTVWVLMVETGLVPPPVRLIQSFRPEDRKPGQPCVVDVNVGIETYYQAWQASQPAEVASADEALAWNPQLFRSDVLRNLWREAQQYARLGVPVLILGERGTGKTTLASWIRANSPFRRKELDKNWPAVACGQYSADTMRAELFGYEKGAFTGAVQRHEGLLARADGDTLFLDEVGDVTRELQRLLIKAVEEGRYQPLGSTKTVESRFRLLSATNLPEARLGERLDLDFLDRIGPLRLRVPALREMRDELDWLWPTVVTEATRRAGVAAKRVRMSAAANAAVLAALRRHPLPGNVRDLFVVAYRLLAVLADPAGHQDAAVESAIAALAGARDLAVSTPDSSTVAAAWASGASLAKLIGPDAPLNTDVLLADFRRYLAAEVRAAAKASQCDSEQLCDVTERTLRSWRSIGGSNGR